MFRLSVDPFPGQELTAEMRSSVDIDERLVPGPADAPDVRVLLYAPKHPVSALPLILSMHGGGFGQRPDMFPAADARLAMLGALVVSVDYRIVPDSRFPDAVEDCYSTLCWAVQELPIDSQRVVLTGISAGGALAAAVALVARDRDGPDIRLQALIIPVLDDRCETPSMLQFEEAPLFGGRMARQMWDTYLGPDIDRSHTPAYAAPGRAEDLGGLPPAFIQAGGLDPLRDEAIIYAQRLMAAGVSVELYCAPAQHHGLSADDRTAEQAARLYYSAMGAAIS
ncbi:MAG: alpha/beta hydrolase [Actinomycetota bacterium]|nr:alpha/beta hydrolase [Actinomycetota bacterium]